MKNKKTTQDKHEIEEKKINKIIRDAFKQADQFGKIEVKCSQKFPNFV